MKQQELIEKIKRLPQDRVTEAKGLDSLSQEPALDRNALQQALNDYANQYGGTDADLDPDLEAAAIEQLLKSD